MTHEPDFAPKFLEVLEKILKTGLVDLPVSLLKSTTTLNDYLRNLEQNKKMTHVHIEEKDIELENEMKRVKKEVRVNVKLGLDELTKKYKQDR